MIEDAIYDEVARALAERASAVRCGDPFDSGAGQGPQCGKAQYEKIVGYIRSGIASGARLLAGGKPLKSNAGYYVPPTLFGEVDQRAAIAQEEIFGPVLVLQRFRGRTKRYGSPMTASMASPLAFTRAMYLARIAWLRR